MGTMERVTLTAQRLEAGYRGRLAPSPTGFLHLGHARTFWFAQERARAGGGALVLRNEDLDCDRCKPEFLSAMMEDLRWFGFRWSEGPVEGGPGGPYTQSERRAFHIQAFQLLRDRGLVYPCQCSRRDVERALGAPHVGEEEPVYPGTCRENSMLASRMADWHPAPHAGAVQPSSTQLVKISWRFRVPTGEAIQFEDGNAGTQAFVAGNDFGDFVVWRHDDVPAYQLAVAVDDAGMGITEVVRGADLLLSTARQLLIYRGLALTPPAFFHCPLMLDERGVRLAKRHDALSLRTLRLQGLTPENIRKMPAFRI